MKKIKIKEKKLKKSDFLILGIESSCDDTAVALVNIEGEIVYQKNYSQYKEHQKFGGVVPEIAARNHLAILPIITNNLFEFLKNNKLEYNINSIKYISVTSGPGLIGGVIVGVMIAKAIATILEVPCIPINHLMGHALIPRMENNIDFPYILLLVSGGHCQILLVKSPIEYSIIGGTIDDALGESFDKVAKILQLQYANGSEIEKIAKSGNPKAFKFPKPLYKKAGCDFSFSGLKTAVKRKLDEVLSYNSDITEGLKSDFAASFQYTVGEILKDRLQNAIMIVAQNNNIKNIVLSGGVAANQYIKKILIEVGNKYKMNLFSPSISLCTDNAVMISWAGIELLKYHNYSEEFLQKFKTLNFEPVSRWPLNNIQDFYSNAL